MSKQDFDHYLIRYSEEYYARFQQDLESIGDIFYGFRDKEFHQWVQGREKMYSFEKFSAPLSTVHTNLDKNSGAPAYAVALEALFYHGRKNNMDEDDGTEKKDIIIQERLAKVCHVGRSTISNWKNGVTLPKKYNWWALAIGELKLSYQNIAPYMDMIGCTVDMTCIDDAILYYALCKEKEMMETYAMLREFRCTHTMKIFSSSYKRNA